MQLREYLAILRRLWPVVALLPLIVGGLSLASALGRPPAYQATARLLVTQAPQPGDEFFVARLVTHTHRYLALDDNGKVMARFSLDTVSSVF
ncbi:MAG: hypothetical protein HGA45_37950 [Chloroflexales bacterium]|nr:hypothetical protein [Chloroflexales bacterium]